MLMTLWSPCKTRFTHDGMMPDDVEKTWILPGKRSTDGRKLVCAGNLSPGSHVKCSESL